MEGVVHTCPGAITGVSSQLFLTLIITVMASQCAFTPQGRYPADYNKIIKDGEEYDFIIVGAGSAGSVVANRLSKNQNWKVLLIEAGTYPSQSTEIPGLSFTLQGTEEDWQYETLPSAKSKNRRKGRCPRGKGLGGSSLINHMIYVRGNRFDYDRWEKAGNAGWGYDSVIKYFKKFENFEKGEGEIYGKGGDLKISQTFNDQPIIKEVINGLKTLGIYQEFDHEHTMGFAFGNYTISEGARYSAAKAFLSGLGERKNLKLVLKAHVSQVIFNDRSKVVGVEMFLNNKLIRVKSRKEVILSAGSINTPQILMNSGVGPRKHLESLGIKVVKELNVGENLQDHLIFSNLFYNVNDEALKETSPKAIIDALYDYFIHKKGTFASSSQLIGFFNHKNESTKPSLQFYPTTSSKGYLSVPFVVEARRKIPRHESILVAEKVNNQEHNNLRLMLGLSYPKSKGRVLLSSKDPFEKPLIYPNYLDDKEDVAIFLDGIRIIQKLMKTDALKRYKPQMVPLDVPECVSLEVDTISYWRCLVEYLSETAFHVVGTCKMGPSSDPEAVVDPRLKLHGIEGVRVIDGSIMPNIVGCNTNAPIIMIGEKGAAMVEQDWAIT